MRSRTREYYSRTKRACPLAEAAEASLGSGWLTVGDSHLLFYASELALCGMAFRKAALHFPYFLQARIR